MRGRSTSVAYGLTLASIFYPPLMTGPIEFKAFLISYFRYRSNYLCPRTLADENIAIEFTVQQHRRTSVIVFHVGNS